MILIESYTSIRADKTNAEEHSDDFERMNGPLFAESADHRIISRFVLAEKEKIVCGTAENDGLFVVGARVGAGIGMIGKKAEIIKNIFFDQFTPFSAGVGSSLDKHEHFYRKLFSAVTLFE